MKKILLFLVFFSLSLIGIAQVGINTTTPQGTLDVVTTNNTGLVLPRVSSIESVTNGNNGSPTNGTAVYDLSRNATCFYQNEKWICIGEDIDGNPILTDETPPFNNCTYIKASNTGAGDLFGDFIALSNDGNTLAIGAIGEDSNTTGINGDQTNNGADDSGAVYIFTRSSGIWSQEAYIKVSNTDVGDEFGGFIALSNDGNTLAIGAVGEDSNATGINGDQTNNGADDSGAVYIFTRSSGIWSQEAYIKASNTDIGDEFGVSIALSGDGNILAVGAIWEDSSATGINGDQNNNVSSNSGAAYIFTRSLGVWSQETYIKASNTDIGDEFGISVALSSDGSTLAIGARTEDSNATGINGNQSNNSTNLSGAVYVFIRSSGVWSQEAYIKASNTGANDQFGIPIVLSSDGNTLVVSAPVEDSNATGIDGDQNNNFTPGAGAVYVFIRTSSVWSQEAYIKASNTGPSDIFGISTALSEDGNILAVGAAGEDSNATGSNGDQNDNGFRNGAVYVFTRSLGVWSQEAYIKASNSEEADDFGNSVAFSGDGNILITGALREDSSDVGINGNQSDNGSINSGAVYICNN